MHHCEITAQGEKLKMLQNCKVVILISPCNSWCLHEMDWQTECTASGTVTTGTSERRLSWQWPRANLGPESPGFMGLSPIIKLWWGAPGWVGLRKEQPSEGTQSCSMVTPTLAYWLYIASPAITQPSFRPSILHLVLQHTEELCLPEPPRSDTPAVVQKRPPLLHPDLQRRERATDVLWMSIIHSI